MRHGLSSAAVLLAVCAAALTVPEWGLAGTRGKLRTAVEQQAGLDRYRDRLLRESDVLNDLALRVAAGDLSLAEAADAAAEVLHDRRGFASDCEFKWNGATPRQGAARCLIAKVRLMSDGDPAAQTARTERLEAEFRTMDPGPGW